MLLTRPADATHERVATRLTFSVPAEPTMASTVVFAFSVYAATTIGLRNVRRAAAET